MSSNLKARYNFVCANCGHEMSAAPSLSMRCGDNFGAASCKNCGTYLHVKITPDIFGEEMKSESYEQYLSESSTEAIVEGTGDTRV